MNIKRFSAILLTLIIACSFASCRDGSNKAQSSTAVAAEETTSEVSTTASESTTSDEDLEASFRPKESEISSEAESTQASDDPAVWSTAQIIEAYKSAAEKSNAKAISNHSINLKSISVNNGQYEGLFEFITPIMSKLISNNSSDKNGITGGYKNLSEADVASAKAYRVGNNIAIEMVMKEQVSGARDDALSGSVGHAITAVGDISEVTKQLTDLGLPLELSDKDTKIYYTDPVVKVLINGNGEIVKGTWRYTVEISLNNYKAFGKKVDTTSVIMDNTLSVNGGF